MSEPERGVTADAAAAAPLTAGAMLRQAREASGLHIAALAVSLKVPVKKLEALEGDRFEQLPDAVFVRALAASVCRTLKIDPAPILARLPQTLAPRLAQNTSGINTPFRAPSDVPRPSLWDQMSRPAMLAVLALLLGAVVLIFLPDIQRQSALAGISRTEASDSAAGPVPVVATSAETVQVNPPVLESGPAAPGSPNAAVAQVASPGGAVARVPGASTTMALSPSVALSTPTVASPTLVVTAPVAAASVQSMVPAAVAAGAPVASAASPTIPGAANGIVTFRADGPSWVEVTDARGSVALRKILAPGEAVGATGALPLSVIVGKADATQVQVRGKTLNLAPLSRDNVARFEVK
jgi:cytoskeleton protein RodZ